MPATSPRWTSSATPSWPCWKHPGQWKRRLRDEPDLVRSAVEEGLRYDGAVLLLHRIAREDLMLRGQTIRQG